MLALRCPNCGAPLDAASGERVFVCRACSRSCTPTSPEGGSLRPLSRIVVEPLQVWAADEALYLLPVWVVPAEGRAPIRIPAVGIDRMPLVLSLAQRLSSLDLPVSEWSQGRALRRSSADLHAAEALELASALLQSDDRDLGRALGGGLSLEDWPCVIRSSQLVELVGGRAASGRLLEGQQAVARGPQLLPVEV